MGYQFSLADLGLYLIALFVKWKLRLVATSVYDGQWNLYMIANLVLRNV